MIVLAATTPVILIVVVAMVCSGLSWLGRKD